MGNNCPNRQVVYEVDYAVNPGEALPLVAFNFFYFDKYQIGLNIENTRFVNQPAGTTVLIWQQWSTGDISIHGIWRNDGQQRDDDGNRVLTPTVPGLPNLTAEMIAFASCTDQTAVFVHVKNPTSPELEWFQCFMGQDPDTPWGLLIEPISQNPVTATNSIMSQSNDESTSLLIRTGKHSTCPSEIDPIILNNICLALQSLQEDANISSVLQREIRRHPKMRLRKFYKKFRQNKLCRSKIRKPQYRCPCAAYRKE